MKKMLYIMGIEWNWIFQRPQILALRLQEDYEVTVVCPKQLIKSGKEQANRSPRHLIELVQIPFQEKVKFIGFFADKLHRYVLGSIDKYDLIWVGYPLYERYIPQDYQGTIIYDCMDNFEALYPDRSPKAITMVNALEKRLLQRADIVFASSCKLKEKLCAIDPKKKIEVIRNGYSDIIIRPPRPSFKKEEYILSYIGTISEWFDSDVIRAGLADCKRISYNLIGPVSRHQEIQSDKVIYRGAVEHRALGKWVEMADCLIMPFKVTEIVLYVDPVKLYEYIAWGKCIIASWYPEIERFQDYVYFYHDKREYLQLLRTLSEQGFPAKYNEKQQQEFLEKNTWEERIRAVKKAIDPAKGL